MDRKVLLDTSKSIITKDRAATHGRAENSFSQIAAYWTVHLQNVGLVDIKQKLTATDIAVMMVLFKVARADSNESHADNWIDMIGYSALAGEIALTKTQTQETQDGNLSVIQNTSK